VYLLCGVVSFDARDARRCHARQPVHHGKRLAHRGDFVKAKSIVHVNSRVHTRTHDRAIWHRANMAVGTYMGEVIESSWFAAAHHDPSS